ncbi:MAG TPA: YkvA family protein [Phenylobacterium sp.]|uniref:YkvA family protein n=1 Tax=Phenylobacterium sp. TaxID=1871053 RepID=UPI002B5AE6BA|nr:YkvA family protein [Phenylobacterium sp.]HSV02283.1 YkvA family protein [Phenylobacterium sp.]
MSGADKASPHVNGVLDPARALVPRVVRLNERIVAKGFWPKLKKVAAHAPFAAEALSVWYCVQDPETPAPAKGMMLAALAYFVLPTDAIPDFIAGIGYTDDAAVFAAMMALVGRNVKPRHRAAAKAAVDRIRERP